MSGGARSRNQGRYIAQGHDNPEEIARLIRYLRLDAKQLNAIDALENRERANELVMEYHLARERAQLGIHREFFTRNRHRVYILRDQSGRFTR